MPEVPKCHYECPYKREAEGDLNTDRGGVNHATTKAEVGVMWPQVESWCGHRKLEETRPGCFLLELLEGTWSCQHLISAQ